MTASNNAAIEPGSFSDAHRTETYLYLKQAPKAEHLLARREKEMPQDYNPPARLARVLLEEKKLTEAEAASGSPGGNSRAQANA